MDWLRSEDLKEEKVVTTPAATIPRQKVVCLLLIDLCPVCTCDIMETVGKKKTKKQSAKATLAEVVKEMAKPRVAMSAREHSPVLSERSSSRGERC
jgi:hypothetical protein